MHQVTGSFAATKDSEATSPLTLRPFSVHAALFAASLKSKEIKFNNYVLRDGQISFAIESPSIEEAQLQLIDITGKTIAIENRKMQVGINTFDIYVPQIPDGIYTASLKTSLGTVNYKFKK